MWRADPAGRCSCLGCQASSTQEALQEAQAGPAAGSPAGQTPLAPLHAPVLTFTHSFIPLFMEPLPSDPPEVWGTHSSRASMQQSEG